MAADLALAIREKSLGIESLGVLPKFRQAVGYVLSEDDF
jgi:hypothetical protein